MKKYETMKDRKIYRKKTTISMGSAPMSQNNISTRARRRLSSAGRGGSICESGRH